MRKKVKILFLIPTLGAGGSQKVLSILLRSISKENFDVTFCVLTDTGVFYDTIPEDVAKIFLGASRVRYSAVKVYRVIKSVGPDVVFVFDVNHLSLIVGIVSCFLPKKIKYLAREAVVLSSFIENYPTYRRILKKLYGLTFKRFDGIICQSNYMKADLTKHFDVQPGEVTVINNPIEVAHLVSSISSKDRVVAKDTFNLIAVGRIDFIKGYDLLMEALRRVKTLKFHLTILGEKTPENPGYSEHVAKLVEDYKLTGKVSFLGFKMNPYVYLEQGDLLVISSRSEAFSNVALEANAVGCPVLAFDSPGGMSEIVSQGVNGWLVENGNIDEFAKAIDRIVDLRLDRESIAEVTRKRYDVRRIVPEYERIILEVLK